MSPSVAEPLNVICPLPELILFTKKLAPFPIVVALGTFSMKLPLVASAKITFLLIVVGKAEPVLLDVTVNFPELAATELIVTCPVEPVESVTSVPAKRYEVPFGRTFNAPVMPELK